MTRRTLRNSEAEWRKTKQRPHRPPTPAKRPLTIGRMLEALGRMLGAKR